MDGLNDWLNFRIHFTFVKSTFVFQMGINIFLSKIRILDNFQVISFPFTWRILVKKNYSKIFVLRWFYSAVNIFTRSYPIKIIFRFPALEEFAIKKSSEHCTGCSISTFKVRDNEKCTTLFFQIITPFFHYGNGTLIGKLN